MRVTDLGFGSVTSAKIDNGSILAEDISSNAITSEKIRSGAVTSSDLADGAVSGSKVSAPLAITGTTAKVLEIRNSSAGGVTGSTLRAINSSPGSGVAGYLETAGTDATLVVINDGTGDLIKAFGSNGGSDEFHVENNGTTRLYNSSHSNTITLNASSGRGTFRELRITGNANASLPIAYAYIDDVDGEVKSGTSNVTCKWEAGNSRYRITIAGETYLYDDYQTLVTPSGSSPPAFAVTSSVGGDLLVTIYDLSGTKIKKDFQFVTFKAP